MITHAVLVRDNSGSMSSYSREALQDFNNVLDGIRKETNYVNKIFGSVVEFANSYTVSKERTNVKIRNKDINLIENLSGYSTETGSTPLFDAVLKAIEVLELNESQRYKTIDENVAYLVMVTTDGQENASIRTNAESLALKIRLLQSTDKWTFVFRVPRGYKNNLVSKLGIPEGNVMEWELTGAALKTSSVATVAATRQYFDSRAKGLTSSTSFYTDLSNISISEVKKELTDITSQVRVEPVWSEDNDVQIRDFCNSHFGEYQVGRAFYQLMKPEKIQGSKSIVIKHLKTGKYYGGPEARNLLGLPDHEIKVIPGDHHQYEIYVQSTSVNRKLKTKTKVLYWKV